MARPCPANAFRFNGTLCACEPGYLMTDGTCSIFDAPAGDWAISSGVEPKTELLNTVLYLDTVLQFTEPQALLLEATLIALVGWLAFCVALRFRKVDGGRSVWFGIRWGISRLDFFATHHWLDDRKVVTKRKTELGGTFSVASWIMFFGLFSVLLYQIIAKRSIEVHSIRPANAPDLLSFVVDMELNLTTISSMNCLHIRGPDTLVSGTPGFIDYRVFPLSSYASSYCQNTSMGPTISLKCNSCKIPRRSYYIKWQFVDLPSNPAMAVGFQFHLTTKSHGDDRHVSYVSGTLNSGNYMNDKPVTFRGPVENVLQVHLFPLAYNYLHGLKLIQPLAHDFVPGSSFSEANGLKASLERPEDGMVNTALHISYLSDYIVEIDHENIKGPVSFLADVGGLYAITLGIFLYSLVQCEASIKKLRNEDTAMGNIRSKGRAQRNWDKLRKFVRYTWGASNMDGRETIRKHHGGLTDTCCGIGSLREKMQPCREESLQFHDDAGMLDLEVGGENNQSHVSCQGITLELE